MGRCRTYRDPGGSKQLLSPKFMRPNRRPVPVAAAAYQGSGVSKPLLLSPKQMLGRETRIERERFIRNDIHKFCKFLKA